MKKLSEFKLIKNRNQIKDSDYIVVVSLSHWTAECGNRNKVTYNDKNYTMSVVKGMFKNMLKRSDEWLPDYNKEQFKDYEIVVGGIAGDAIEVLAFKTFDDMIKDCSVYSHPEKVEVDVDKDAIIHCIESKPKMYHPSHN